MKRSTMIELMVLLLILLGLSGCIGFQAFPLAARSGDTITLALGGSPYHEVVHGDQITMNDLNIKIQQDINGNGVIDSNETFTVTKRYLFRLYPDLTSGAANAGAYTDPLGEWSAVLDLADPTTHNPLPLVGNRQATIIVTTSKLRSMWTGNEGTLSSIPITILTGTGQSHNFNNQTSYPFADIANLQPLPQLAITFSGSGYVAAVALDIDYDKTVLGGIAGVIKIRQDISIPDVILNQRIYDDNGNKKMRILLMTNYSAAPADMLKCFVVWNKKAVALGKTVTTNTFNVTSAKFYDESGAEVTGISVVKTLLYQ